MAEPHETGVDSPADFRNSVSYWDAELRAYERVTENWNKDSQRISDRYTLEGERGDTSAVVSGSSGSGEFNILASNVQTMLPAIFGKTPVPVVTRRHRDRDPVARVAAEILQRAVRTELENDALDDTMTRVALDLLLCGRGVPWVRYDPVFVDEEGPPADAKTPIDYVKRQDFAHALRTTWAEVKQDGWVARRASMTRDQGVRRFGDVFRKVPLKDRSPGMTEDEMDDDSKREVIGRASVWEIWDARTGKAIWLNRDYGEKVLDEREDPLSLDDFFPCPMPAFGAMGNNRMVPIPDYLQYEGLARELDRQTARIAALTRALRVTGVYDGAMESIGRMLSNDGTDPDRLIAVTEFSSLGGRTIEQVVLFLPLRAIVEGLVALYDARERTKQVLYEVSGLSDIMRGQVDPREKLGQSRLKGQFASQRLQQKVKVMENVARDALAIKAEIMAEHYDPAMLRQMSGFDFMPEVEEARRVQSEQFQAAMQQFQAQMQGYQEQAMQAMQQGQPAPPIPQPPEQPPDIGEEMFSQAIQLLRDEKLRGFRLDIETNSTLMLDDDEEKQRRSEFLEATGSFLERALPVAQNVPQLTPLFLEMMQFAVRGFRAGRQLEGAFEQAVESLRAPPEPQKGEEGPTPEEQAAQAKAETEMQVMQAKAQSDMQTMQAESQNKMLELQIKRAELQAKIEADQIKAETDAALTEAEIETKLTELNIERERLEMEREDLRQKALIQIATAPVQGAQPPPQPTV